MVCVYAWLGLQVCACDVCGRVCKCVHVVPGWVCKCVHMIWCLWVGLQMCACGSLGGFASVCI